MSNRKFGWLYILTVSVALLSGFQSSEKVLHADPIPKGWRGSNMKAIGYSGLDGRGGAFKMVVRQVADLCARGFSHVGTSA
jgi:hypothetical protein